MTAQLLTLEEKKILLRLAREHIGCAVQGEDLPLLDLAIYPEALQAIGSSFVTLMRKGELRGCIGALEPYQALVQDVCEHAVAAAASDYRFEPVRAEEVPLLCIEISRLTPPVELQYDTPADLPGLLRPFIDGVVFHDGFYRATFLPQVWEKLPDPVDFLDHLSMKMGAPAGAWRRKKLKVFTYQVEEFQEGEE